MITPPARILVVLLGFLLLLPGCEKKPTPPKKAAPDLHALRVLALLHAERDTPRGYEESAKIFESVVAANPENFDDRVNLARVLIFIDGRHEAALAALDAAKEKGKIAESELPASWWFLRGVALDRRRDYGASRAAYQRAEALRKNHPQSLFRMGDALANSGKLPEAALEFERLLPTERLLRPTSYRLYRLYKQLGRKSDEERCLKIFQKTDPDAILDTEKCDLTRVRLRPESRARAEAPRVTLSWKDAPASWHPKETISGIRDIIPLRPEEGDSAAILLATHPALKLLRYRGGQLRTTRSIPIPGTPPKLIRAGDLDNDGRDELVLVGDGGISILSGARDYKEPWTRDIAISGIQSLRLLDVDHDGDLDAVITRKEGSAQILRNSGNKSFELQTPLAVKLPALTEHSRFDAHDLDQASDLDLVFAGGQDGPVVALNHRLAGYKCIPLPALGRRDLVLVEDLNNDGAPDILAVGQDGSYRLLLNRDPFGEPYRIAFGESARSGKTGIAAPHSLGAGDLDNDGDLDLLLAGKEGVVSLRNQKGGELSPEPILPGVSCQIARAIDLDGDGRLEVLAATSEGRLKILWSTATPAYAGMQLLPSGRRDNEEGYGTVVELYAGACYQSAMVKSPEGLHLGVGHADLDAISGLFARWPLGIRQGLGRGEKELGKRHRFPLREPQGLVASCPFLYVLGPSGWRFQSDVVGIAPLDEWLPDGTTPQLDPEEFIRIPPGALTPDANGRVHLAITEELRETTYLDRAELHWIDHTPKVDLLCDESTRQGRYEPLNVSAVPRAQLRSPRSVAVAGVPDAAARVQKRDGVYLHGYPKEPSQWAGWVERYAIDLVLDAAATTLVLNGRIAWYDSTVSYAISQQGLSFGPLRLERIGPDGRATVLVPDLGVPAGMDRSLVVPFASHPLPAGTQLRLSGQHRFLWDSIHFAAGVHSSPAKSPAPFIINRGEAQVASATLGWHGYSAVVGNRALHEQSYDHDSAGPDGSFPRPRGLATRYGDVRELLLAHDDHLVVLAPGDRCELSFDVPPCPEGQRRSFFLKLSGWAKEASYHNSTGQWIAPLPFRAMSSYPPKPGERPIDPGYESYLKTWQTRRIRR